MMTYLGDFEVRIEKNDYPGFLKLWEEYCYSDEFEAEEFKKILQKSLASPLSHPFGKHVEKGLILWKKILDSKDSHDVLKLIFQIQTTHSNSLFEMAIDYLKNAYPNDPLFQEKLRIIGLRPGEPFQGAISNYELLTHMKKGAFVYHKGGWGASEILDISLIREELALECEHVAGTKHLSFSNAFKTLIPIPSTHFLARRFGDPDLLERQAKENSTEIIRTLLKDLGPKTAAEIKEELLELVIPEGEWNRWWQNTRNRLKKDTKVSCPKTLKEPFCLLEEAIPHEVAFYKKLEAKPGVEETIQMVYTFLRDFSETLKNKDFKASLEKRIRELLEENSLTSGERVSLLFFLEDLLGSKKTNEAEELIKQLENMEKFISSLLVISFKKRALSVVRSVREDWKPIFLDLLFLIEQNIVRDFLLQELMPTKDLQEKIKDLLRHPISYPYVFIWYFQKILEKNSSLPFSDDEGLSQFFEGFFVLLDHLGRKPDMRDLNKKMVGMITKDRYKLVRDIMGKSSKAQVQEFLLLSTKCNALNDHDIKIISSLAEVVFPELAEGKVETEEEILWTTAEGYQKAKERIEKIATIDSIENAKEIEEARSHGDLKENSEFKFALEKRARLQAEIKSLSDQLQASRILTRADILEGKVGVGSIVTCKGKNTPAKKYTILGPWEANPEEGFLSFQSKLAKAMEGLSVGESFSFNGEEFEIVEIDNYFDVN